MLSAFIAALPTVALKLLQAYEARGSSVDLEKLALIQLELDSRQARKEIIVAEQGHFLTRSIRPLFALPFVLYAWKVVAWDKVIAPMFGIPATTDSLAGPVADWATVVIAGYFVYDLGSRVATKLTQK